MANRAPRPPCGVEFPPGPKNDRSTTDFAKSVWEASFSVLDKNLAEKVKNERKWRFSYDKYIVSHVQESLKSPNRALTAAKAGINKLHSSFLFVRGEETMTLAEAMEKITTHSFHTGVVKGTKPKPINLKLEVPYKGKNLSGQELADQAQKWADYGTIEQSAADAISKVALTNEWADLSDQYFVLLGAGAAMGPFLVLMALGANVIACDLDRAPIWDRLLKVAKDSCGTLTFPLKQPQSELKTDADLAAQAGCNLMTEPPEIAAWVQTLYEGKQLTIGSYVYLDGGNFVKVSTACDAIINALCRSRKDTAVAFLCTPTDCHVIPKEAHDCAAAAYSSMNLGNILMMPIRALSSTMLVNNAPKPVLAEDGNPLYYVNGLVVPQGPNYGLAKRLQHWRAILERSMGHIVSSNIAPSTATLSVVKNRQFAWAYDGMPFFKPMEIFQQETSNAVMAALLINDLRNPKSAANPEVSLSNPLEMFAYNSFHGGVWRTAYTIGSIGEVSVLIHFIKVLRPILIVLILLALAYMWFL
eukprot:CAMPEP_0114623162 /NCGR_PEP_ID=MMETSP0168-20121206/10104_1 /TAXON_ID=95228 ORGANISM="Vannella sp., Strain DIVA3 517/6/12" /NCGR_SAMPLE_ID=MMETSP0168 /ASSEMBLY_ACC=CAM_ASM_000044 /LENGTH=528 /DNA_ID=CAMNT_0001834387 /DNA_START=29 /DNA_END=1615 /DNA_ORIENTATION=+